MAINLKGKKTSLNEEASIYQKRTEELSQKERWQQMNAKQKRSYFATYYLPPLLIILAVVAVFGYIIWHDFINNTNIYFNCALLNETATDGDLTSLSDQFTTRLGMEPEDNKVAFSCYYTNKTTAGEAGANLASDLSALSGKLVAGILDGMIASEEDAMNYMENGFFQGPETVLSPEEYDALKEHLYVPDIPKNKYNKALGICLKDSTVYQNLFVQRPSSIEKPIFFIISNGDEDNKKYARDIIKLFFPEIFEQGKK